MKNLMFLMAFVLFSGMLSAQRGNGQRPERGGKDRIETMVQELDLTADQQQKIEFIQANAKAKRDALRSAELSDDQRKEKQREIGKETRDAINDVLTAEQRAKMRTMQGEKRGKKRPNLSPETKAEVAQYKEENIKPTLEGARRELERSISAADRQEIARLRAVMATNPVAEKRKEKGNKKAQKSEVSTAEREAMKAEAKQWKEAHAADLESLEQLTEKYRDEMASLMEQVESERKQWKDDLKEITAADRAEKAESQPGKGKGKGKQGMKGKKQKAGKKMSRFLLMDPNK